MAVLRQMTFSSDESKSKVPYNKLISTAANISIILTFLSGIITSLYLFLKKSCRPLLTAVQYESFVAVSLVMVTLLILVIAFLLFLLKRQNKKTEKDYSTQQ
jgi:nitric oxide reductase large subunit